MHANPILRKLGFSDHDRLAIIHADDVGMCQATLPAFADLIDFGLVSCGAIMVPCPWFPQAAAVCRANPQFDVGAHLTLNSEWDAYRWGPVSTRDPASGLMDEEGYFHRGIEAVQANASADAVEIELHTQVERAAAAGIDLTHVDTHMGAVAHPRFMATYVGLALQYRLPAMVPRLDEAGWLALGLDPQTAALAAAFVEQVEAQGLPLLDGLTGLPLDRPEDRVEQAKRALDALPPGITHFIIHPAQDTPELRAATPRTWQARVADYRAFSSEALRDHVRNSGVQVIGYHPLRDLMR